LTVSLKDQLPRVFQANLARLYERLILPVMDSMPYHGALDFGEATTLDQFLDRAKAQVDNYTGDEAAKAFVLTLAALFERQLSIWARTIQDAGVADMTKLRGYEPLLADCAKVAGIELVSGGLGDDLIQISSSPMSFAMARANPAIGCEHWRPNCGTIPRRTILTFYQAPIFQASTCVFERATLSATLGQRPGSGGSQILSQWRSPIRPIGMNDRVGNRRNDVQPVTL